MMKKPELPLAAPPPAPRAVTMPAAAPAKPPRPAPPARVEPHASPENDRLCDPPVKHEPIIGAGDRAHHLALVAGTAVMPPRPPTARTAERLQALRPASRAACERRCGRAGQCDPASPFGCGGEYCRGFEGRLY
jgi:hypothetical protein